MPSGGIRAVMGVVVALIRQSCRRARPEMASGPLPDRLISASRSFPQTATCLHPVQPPSRRRSLLYLSRCKETLTCGFSCRAGRVRKPGPDSPAQHLWAEPNRRFLPVRLHYSENLYYLCNVSMRLCFAKQGVPGFDSRQSLIVSTPSAVWRLVNPDARFTNGNNSYALAA